ncbi:zona pellucida sperm-binding protein 3-like [Diretmus argenteus]
MRDYPRAGGLSGSSGQGWRTIRLIRTRCGASLREYKAAAGGKRLFKHTKMSSSLRILLLLSCAGLAAAAHAFEWTGQAAKPWSARHPHHNEAPIPVRQQEPGRAQEPVGLQEKQYFQEPLAWRFPGLPELPEPRFPSEFELKQPVAAHSVTVQCGESSVRVEAKKDLLGIGTHILPSDITLGDCPATGEDSSGQVLIFESELHGCGSQLVMSEDSFVYVFILHYTPSPLGNRPIVRTRDVAVRVECVYQRKHNVSSDGLKPTWMPYLATKTSEESLHFSLKLMTDDWQFARPSYQYILGDMIKVEASVDQFYHVPLRVFVDDCVATLIPNADTVPRYAFLGNRGCLVDGQLTGSNSHFMPRTEDNKLRFQIEAFRFQQDERGVIYITCHLRATTVVAPIGATNKACSFSNGWREAGGNHHACSCCDADCTGGSGPNFTGLGMDTAFKKGDQALSSIARANLKKGIRKAKADYKSKIEDCLQSNNTRKVWQGIQHMTNFKPSKPMADGDASTAEELNSFFARFEQEPPTATPAPTPPLCTRPPPSSSPPTIATLSQ